MDSQVWAATVAADHMSVPAVVALLTAAALPAGIAAGAVWLGVMRVRRGRGRVGGRLGDEQSVHAAAARLADAQLEAGRDDQPDPVAQRLAGQTPPWQDPGRRP